MGHGPLFTNSRGKPWTKNAIVLRFARLRNKLKLPKGLIAYALRHTYITEALVNEVPISTVADLAGNSERMIRRSCRSGACSQSATRPRSAVIATVTPALEACS
jgi:hypothetical protein